MYKNTHDVWQLKSCQHNICYYLHVIFIFWRS